MSKLTHKTLFIAAALILLGVFGWRFALNSQDISLETKTQSANGTGEERALKTARLSFDFGDGDTFDGEVLVQNGETLF